MAISQVRAQINGTWHTLTYNSQTSAWEATVTAPGVTSYNLPGGYYPVTLEATNTAGTTATATTTDPTVGDDLKLVVKETVAPTITIVSPSSGAYVTNSQQPVVFQLRDEVNGSGINIDSLVVKLDGATQSSGISSTAVTNGYDCTFTPASPMGDGPHTVTIDVSDNDGNAATQATTSFTVDTVPPVLNITYPTEGLVTATASLTIQGATNDSTSSPVTVTVSLNSVDQGSVTVDSSGNFTKTVTLAEGANTIIITSTDQAGRSTSVTRHVTLDTSTPEFVSVTITPNPVDAGETMVIRVVVQ